MKTLNDLFLNELADMQEAERRIVKALPKMPKAATRSHLESRGRKTERGKPRPRRPHHESVLPDTGPEQFLNFW